MRINFKFNDKYEDVIYHQIIKLNSINANKHSYYCRYHYISYLFLLFRDFDFIFRIAIKLRIVK